MSRASAQRAASAVATAFESDGFTLADETVLGLSGTLAYKRVFRWRWYATRLHIFSFVVGLERADIETVQQQTEALIELALLRKPPLPRGLVGLQTGIAAVPVVVGQRVDDAAAEWARRPAPRQFAAIRFPVVARESGPVAYLSMNIAWGRVYLPCLRALVERNVVAPLSGAVTASGPTGHGS
jgi:hypothetical protein